MGALVLCLAFVTCVIHIVFATVQPESLNELPDRSSSSSSEFISTVKSKSSTRSDGPSPQKTSTTILPFENVADRLANLKERIRLGAYNAAGVIYETGHPLREDIHRQAHNTAGILYETGGPMRKSLSENKNIKLAGIALKIYEQLELKGKTREEKIKVIVDVVSEELVKHAPIYTTIPPIEINGMSKYICGVKGKMMDLTSMKKVNTDVKVIEDDRLEIQIDYTFSDLHFNYTEFHIHGLGLEIFQVNGWLDIKFKSNIVRITLQIPKFTEIIPNLALKRCVVHVIKFEVTELEFVRSTLSGRKGSKRRKILSGKIKEYLSNNPDYLKADFEKETLVEIHRALTTKGHWVCKDEDFGELVKSKGGSLDKFVPKDIARFEQYCGTDYFIEPYKKTKIVEETDSST